ncbi:MAG: cell division protein ZapE [Pseudomonadota bacterium]
MTPSQKYNDRVQRGVLREDPIQREVLALFDQLAADLADYNPKPGWLRSGLFGVPPKPPKGLYVYGGVGRGKSMLMDLFYDTVQIRRKRRVHFHAFMQEIHAGMHEARQSGVTDAIKPVAEKVIKDAKLLCFDEMQITDITDAMIVGRLFEQLFDAGIIIVTTSNRHPSELYKDGLNRHLFLPFIELMETRLIVHNLDSETDYRQNRLADEQVYFFPVNAANNARADGLWAKLITGSVEPIELKHRGRSVNLPEFSGGVARASFADLCEAPLGPADYLEIASAVRVLFLTNVPKLDGAAANAAKRFVTLIDALYEAKTRLIVTAAAAPEDLYTSGTGAFEFERSASRLREMMSAGWGA